MNVYFQYGMKLHGLSLDGQPRDCFVKVENDTTGKYFDILTYSRHLTEYECEKYGLDYLGEVVF